MRKTVWLLAGGLGCLPPAGEPPPACTPGAEREEGCPVPCEVTDDQCLFDEICLEAPEGSFCQKAFPRDYHFSGFQLQLGAVDAAGAPWDPQDGTAPDPQLVVSDNEGLLLVTGTAENSFTPLYPDSFVHTLVQGANLDFAVRDRDPGGGALVLRCDLVLATSTALRARTIHCETPDGVTATLDVTVRPL